MVIIEFQSWVIWVNPTGHMTRKIASVTNKKAIHISRLFWSAKAILLNAPIADNKVGITIGINNRGNTSSLYFVFKASSKQKRYK